MAQGTIKRKLFAHQARLDHCGSVFKHTVVFLLADQTLDWALSTPEAWTAIQSDGTTFLSKGDECSIWSADSTVLAKRVTVTKAEEGCVWFGKPTLVKFEESGYYRDELYEVVPVGNRFALKSIRGGAVESRLFATARAAELEIQQRKPTRAA